MAVTRQAFDTEAAAFEWLYALLDSWDERCIDNERFTFEDDATGLAAFEKQREEGCCGSVEYAITVAGRDAIIGCNYGH